jgi:uncharacterized tellurite resistance protein B-like protein
MSEKQLSLLVQLAAIDGQIVQSEIDLIHQIGKALGLSVDEINSVFEKPVGTEDLSTLSDEEKYDYIYNLVDLMKIDGKLYQEEIRFCAHMASRLGYDEPLLYELITKIYQDKSISYTKDELKEKVQSYLKKK